MAAGIRYGESGMPWRGIDPSKKGNHWKFTIQKLDELDKQSRIHFPKKAGGVPRYKRYLDEMPGVLLQDIWTDIRPISSHSKERLGFQTQKPQALLERIIKSSTVEGGLILDPFCGCGTAIIAAESLHRKWIGIDITYLAISLIESRLKLAFRDIDYRLEGQPRDLVGAKALAASDRFEFQCWAVSLIGAAPEGSTLQNPKKGKKGRDEGIDGWLKFPSVKDGHTETILVQVKSGNIGVKDIREFRDVVNYRRAAMGIFITLQDPTSEMVKEVKRTEPYIQQPFNIEYPKLQIVTIQQLIDQRNKLRLQMPSTLPHIRHAEQTERIPRHHEDKLI